MVVLGRNLTMAEKTIPQVISDVLSEASRPMTSRDIYELIAQKRLYDFKAKDPASVVRKQLRRHCVQMKSSLGAGAKYFRMTDDGLFELLESPIDNRNVQPIDVFVPSWEGGSTKSGYKVEDYVIWPHPYTDGVWLARKGGPVVPGKLGRFTSVEAAISWAYEQMGRTGANPVEPTKM